VGGQCHAPAVLLPGNDSVPIVQGAGWTPGQVWTGAKGVASTGVQTPQVVAILTTLSRHSSYLV